MSQLKNTFIIFEATSIRHLLQAHTISNHYYQEIIDQKSEWKHIPKRAQPHGLQNILFHLHIDCGLLRWCSCWLMSLYQGLMTGLGDWTLVRGLTGCNLKSIRPHTQAKFNP